MTKDASITQRGEQDAQHIRTIPLSSLRPDETQPRRVFGEEALEELAASIRRDGIIQPLIVRSDGDGWRIVVGERRWRAAKRAGIETVPCVVRDGLTATDVARIQLVENLQRVDLEPLEKARAYRAALDGGLTQEALADSLGVARATVATTLRLLEAPRDALIALKHGLPERAAVELLRLRVFDRVCGPGTMDRLCAWTLWNPGRARTFHKVRHYVDYWLAELRWVYVDATFFDGEFLTEYEAELRTAEEWRLFHWAAWIRSGLKPDLSKLNDTDKAAMERAFRRVMPVEGEDESIEPSEAAKPVQEQVSDEGEADIAPTKPDRDPVLREGDA